jgi:hypothetical protein
MRKAWLLLALVMGAPSWLTAESPPIQVNPNRPTFATPGLTTQIGAIELEFGLQHSAFRGGAGLSLSPYLLKLGLLESLEFRIGGNGVLRQTSSDQPSAIGFGDTAVGVQWCYLRDSPVGQAAVQLTVKLPTASASRGLGSGKADTTLMLILSRDLGAFHVDANLLETWLGLPPAAGGGTARQTAGTVSITRTLDEQWSLTGELYSLEATPQNPFILSNLWAVAYKVSPSLVLDGGFDLGLSHGAQRVSLFAGLTLGVGRFRHVAGP